MSEDAQVSGSAAPAGGPEHDAWLREALRHAPDATAAPPLSLREAILAEARVAAKAGTRTVPVVSLADRFAKLWEWLARPPVAAGFASFMAATLVGLMWWDRPMDEAMPQPPPASVSSRVAAAPAEAQAPAPAPAVPAPVHAPAPAIASMQQKAAPQTEVPVTPRAPAALAQESARRPVLAPPAGATADRAAAPPAKTAPATDALGDERKDAGGSKLDAAAPPAAAPVPFPAPGRSDRDARPAADRAEPSTLAKKAERAEKESAATGNRLGAALPPIRETATAGTLSRSAEEATDATPAAGLGKPQPQPQPAAARQRAAAEPMAPGRPMTPLLASLASESSRWTRQAGGGGSVALDGALQAWLAGVDAAAAQWQPRLDRPSRLDSALAPTAARHTLVLDRDGRPGAIVRLEDGGVAFEMLPGPAWFAPLAPEAVARLRATLPSAAR